MRSSIQQFSVATTDKDWQLLIVCLKYFCHVYWVVTSDKFCHEEKITTDSLTKEFILLSFGCQTASFNG